MSNDKDNDQWGQQCPNCGKGFLYHYPGGGAGLGCYGETWEIGDTSIESLARGCGFRITEKNVKFNPDQEDLGMAWMHVYPQTYPHSSPLIRGNRKALEALREAIDDALGTRGKEGGAKVFARDGEGYTVRVIQVSTLDQLGEGFYLDDLTRGPKW